MSKYLERDIQTLGRTEGNLKFLIHSYVDGRLDYKLAKTAVAHEARFLERLIEVRLGTDYVLLTTLWEIKNSPVKVVEDEDAVHDIIGDCTTLIAVSKIVLEELKEVRDK